jgi:hypothetical protein
MSMRGSIRGREKDMPVFEKELVMFLLNLAPTTKLLRLCLGAHTSLSSLGWVA